MSVRSESATQFTFKRRRSRQVEKRLHGFWHVQRNCGSSENVAVVSVKIICPGYIRYRFSVSHVSGKTDSLANVISHFFGQSCLAVIDDQYLCHKVSICRIEIIMCLVMLVPKSQGLLHPKPTTFHPAFGAHQI